MAELVYNARMGWRAMLLSGKYEALLIIALFYVGFKLINKSMKLEDDVNSANRKLMLYSIIMSIACICPVTAAVLMLYQTRFFDYFWIWSAVPVNAVIAYAVTDIIFEINNVLKKEKGYFLKMISFVIGLFMIIVLSVSGTENKKDQLLSNKKALYTREILREIIDSAPKGNLICLWGPTNIIENARLQEDNIFLYYGRNMWDKSLNAYFYDTYDDKRNYMYEFMELVSKEDGYERIDDAQYDFDLLKDYIELALMEGLNTIVLPVEAEDIEDEGVALIIEYIDSRASYKEKIEDYNILYFE